MSRKAQQRRRRLPADFTPDGLLPPGDYPLTIDELLKSMLVAGPRMRSDTWDADWRRRLVKNLHFLAEQLWQVGISDIFVDGSFVEDKDHPNDLDGYFVCEVRRFATGELERALNLLDPYKSWTWDPAQRRSTPGDPKCHLPMWHVYRVELYPHFGQLAGISDEHGHELEFPSAFRLSRRAGKPRGIIQLIRGAQ